MNATIEPRASLLTRIREHRVARALTRFGEHGGPDMAASVTFYAIFSLFPLLLGLIAVLGLFVDSDEVQRELLERVSEALPSAKELVRSNIELIVSSRGTVGALGLIGVFWSASGLFGALIRGLDRAHAPERPRPAWREKLLSIAMALSVGLLFVLSAVSTATLQFMASLPAKVAGELVGSVVAELSWLLDLVGRFVGLGIETLALTMLYTVAPSRRVRARDVWPAALLAAILFNVLKAAFVFYLASFANYQAVYGPLGSIIALLFWVLLSAQVVLLGGEVAALRHAELTSAGGAEAPA
ncbi:MAG: YihY/virulence factor BrkB family protein [Myxococcales bacterium]|nr:YihY/virulence factor BrkB family protein [Myxococcales bacterium]